MFHHLLETLKPRSNRARRRADKRRRTTPERLRLEHLEDRSVPSFSPALSYPNVPGFSPSPESGDFNGDGRLDLVTAVNGGVSVMLNQGGTFSSAIFYPVGAYPVDVSVGDFNGDGKLDLATANPDTADPGDIDRSLSLLLGNGDGTFGVPRTLPLGQIPRALTAGDFNGDGHLDLVAANVGAFEGGASLSVAMGNGDGTFRSPTNLPTSGTRPVNLATGDFNGDGRLDLVVGDNYGSSQVRLGNGDGTFQTNPTWSIGAPVVAVGDFNGDGHLDLAGARTTWVDFDPEQGMGNYAHNAVLVSLGRGDGTFTSGFTSGWNVDSYSSQTGVAAADFNGDGRIDLALTYQNDRQPHLLTNQGGGHFVESGVPLVGSPPDFVLAADFNGDGRTDLATTSSSGGNVALLLNDGIWLPHLTISGATVIEGDDGSTDLVFTVRLSMNPEQPTTVEYGTSNGSATAGLDYLARGGTLTFLPGGPLVQTIAVPVLGDRIAEGFSYSRAEWFALTLSNPNGAFLQNAMADGIILDDEPRVSLSRPTIAEGDAGSSDAVFTLTLSAPSTIPVTVAYTTYDLDPDSEVPLAAAGSDYLASSGTVTFPAGSTTQTLRVPILGDTVIEGDEYFGLRVNSTQAHADPDHILGVIADDEAYVWIDPASVTERNAGTTAAIFTVNLSRARSQPVTVQFRTADGTARAGSDYLATSGSVTFAPGETSKTVSVLVKGDRLPEPNESFTVNLSNPTNATLSLAQAEGSIVDDEPRLSIGDVSWLEGRKGKTTLFTFTVSLAVAYDQVVTVSYRTINGTAKTSDSDYVAKTGTLTFAPGQTSKTITIEVKGDSKRESNEYFYLDLFGNSSNSLITKNRGIGTILNDD